MRLVATLAVLAFLALFGTVDGASAAWGDCRSTATGDVDGDGRLDTALLRLDSGRCTSLGFGTFLLTVDLGTGERIGRHVWQCEWECRLLSPADLNGDGRDEILVVMIAGASTQTFAVFTARDGRIDRARAVGPLPENASTWITFAQFGTVMHDNDFRCARTHEGAPFVIDWSYGLTPVGGSFSRMRYDVSERRWWFDGGDFRFASEARWSFAQRGEHGEDTPHARGERCV